MIQDTYLDEELQSDIKTESACIRDKLLQILLRVIKQDGTCPYHKVGDEVPFTGDGVKGKICLSALYSIIPKVYAMRYIAYFPWLEDQYISTHTCPDYLNPVVFEVIRKPVKK